MFIIHNAIKLAIFPPPFGYLFYFLFLKLVQHSIL